MPSRCWSKVQSSSWCRLIVQANSSVVSGARVPGAHQLNSFSRLRRMSMVCSVREGLGNIHEFMRVSFKQNIATSQRGWVFTLGEGQWVRNDTGRTTQRGSNRGPRAYPWWWDECRACKCLRGADVERVPLRAAAWVESTWARTQRVPVRFGRHPARQLKTTHAPESHPTPTAPRILLQSCPSPVLAHPPQDSSDCEVSRHCIEVP